MVLIKNDQVERLILEALKPLAKGLHATKRLPLVRIYQEHSDQAPCMRIDLIHEDFEHEHLDGRAGFSTFPVNNAQEWADRKVKPLVGRIQEITGAGLVDFVYWGDQKCSNEPFGSHFSKYMTVPADPDSYDEESDENRAGWPSKTGNPSGRGRDNNPPK